MKLADTRKLMEKHGIPGTDARDLPTSTKRFPDGAWYRMEISGIERPNVLEAAIDEMNKRKIPLHRMISMVMGATYMTKSEWKDFAQMAAEAKLEVIVTPGPRTPWYTGRQVATPEGASLRPALPRFGRAVARHQRDHGAHRCWLPRLPRHR